MPLIPTRSRDRAFWIVVLAMSMSFSTCLVIVVTRAFDSNGPFGRREPVF
jgi:hypothetical protein